MRHRLEPADITTHLTSVPDWSHVGDEIVRTFELTDFASAIAFVVQIGFLAEAKDHHPDLDIRWRRVRVALTTHDLGGLGDWDFELAAAIDALAAVG